MQATLATVLLAALTLTRYFLFFTVLLGLNGDACVVCNRFQCAIDNGGCGLQTCTNTVGSFTCGSCPSGYKLVNGQGCVDINGLLLFVCLFGWLFPLPLAAVAQNVRLTTAVVTDCRRVLILRAVSTADLALKVGIVMFGFV